MISLRNAPGYFAKRMNSLFQSSPPDARYAACAAATLPQSAKPLYVMAPTVRAMGTGADLWPMI